MVSAAALVAEARAQSLKGRAPILTGHVPDLNGNGILEAVHLNEFEIVPSRDGAVATVEHGEDENDFSRRTGPFDWHKDGLYRSKLPGFVLLYCVCPGRGDSPTAVADCAAALETFEGAERQILEHSELIYVSHGGREHPHPLVQRHPRCQSDVLHVAQRAWIKRPQPSVGRDDELLPKIWARLETVVVHQQNWKAGDLLIVDNFQYAHARKSMRPDTARQLLRVWCTLEA